GDVGFGSPPDGGLVVQDFFLAVLVGQGDGMGNVFAVFADDGADAVILEELVFLVLDVDFQLGAAIGLVGFLQGVRPVPGGFPAYGGLGGAEALGGEDHLVGHHEYG